MLVVGDRQHRTLIECVGPDADLAGQVGERQDVGGAVAVADVDDPLHGQAVSQRVQNAHEYRYISIDSIARAEDASTRSGRSVVPS